MQNRVSIVPLLHKWPQVSELLLAGWAEMTTFVSPEGFRMASGPFDHYLHN